MYKEQIPRDFGDGRINCTGNSCFEGYCIDLLAKLAERIETVYKTPFRYELHLVRDGKFGSIGADGMWNGMIGELLTNVRTLQFFFQTISIKFFSFYRKIVEVFKFLKKVFKFKKKVFQI